MIWFADSISVESEVIAFYISQNRIVLAIERAPNGRRAMISPNDLIEQMIVAEDFIQQYASIRINMPIEMEIKSSIRRKQTIHQIQALIQEIKIRIKVKPMIRVTFG